MNTEREELRALVDGSPGNWHGGYQWVADVTVLLDELDAKDAELAEAHHRIAERDKHIAEFEVAVDRALDLMAQDLDEGAAETLLRVVVRDD